jgi:hypothetical protein
VTSSAGAYRFNQAIPSLSPVIDPTVLTCPLVPLFRGARRDRGYCAGDRVAVLS